MSRVLLIGCGGVGTVAAHKLAQNADVFTDICIASRTKSKCDATAEAIRAKGYSKNGVVANITTAQVDADSVPQLVALMKEFKPELYNEEEWDHLSYDLSEYAGQLIYVALKAEASSCLGAFYDNFEFAHFTSTFDVNLDGAVDGNDLNCLINHVLGKQTWPNGDVNGDGAIDGNDINAMINHLLGK